MSIPDIQDLTLPELLTLKASIDEQIARLRAVASGELRTRFEAEAKALGLTFEEIAPTRRRGRPRRSNTDHDRDSGGGNG